ncbi:dTMP kinase [Arthrobacter sp. CAN_A214]|uniref:AAA family ATPase n=1 Tax=Arthrobacter sp. CAN_A214 TaxID=2787720 RepID=UPI001A1AF7A6
MAWDSNRLAHRTKGPALLIVLTGIDGAGKTTAALAVVDAARASGKQACLLRNPAGRLAMASMWTRLGIRPAPRVEECLESSARIWNVLINTVRARRRCGLVLMDRGLVCQLALRQMRGLPRGHVIPWLLSVLPRPDAVVHFELEPALALKRIDQRAADTETLPGLTAFHAGYVSLPEYATFTVLDASRPPASVQADLAAIAGRGSGCDPKPLPARF